MTTAGMTGPDDARSVDRSALWTRTGRNLLYGFGNMYNLHVLDTPERPYRYRGWFFGWAVKDCNRHIPGYEGCDAPDGRPASPPTGEPHRGWPAPHYRRET